MDGGCNISCILKSVGGANGKFVGEDSEEIRDIVVGISEGGDLITEVIEAGLLAPGFRGDREHG